MFKPPQKGRYSLSIFLKNIGIIFIFLLISDNGIAQEFYKKTGLVIGKGNYNGMRKKKMGSANNPSLSSGGGGSSKWAFGLKGGVNFTKIFPGDQFSVFSYTKPTENSREEKQYVSISDNKGFHVTFIAKYRVLGNLQVSVQPTFSTYKYTYENDYAWFDFDNTTNSLDLTYSHIQSLNYIELPILIRYDIMDFSIRPFVQAGGFYGRLLSASKEVKLRGTDYAAGASEKADISTTTIGVDDLYVKSNYGLIAGGGISYRLGAASVELGVDYKFGMNDIVDKSSRFKESRIVSGSYDILDDTKLSNFLFSVGFIFGL